jgi:mevalonate kinase
MMHSGNINLSAPSKTFLVGEYAVLGRFCAILLSTHPRFNLDCFLVGEPAENDDTSHVGGQSPFYVLTRDYADVFSHYRLKFSDPHSGGGGFGASSAKFLMAYRAVTLIKNEEFSISKALEYYRAISAGLKDNVRPSGADVAAQYNGGVTYLSPTSDPKDIGWPFKDITALIFKTGVKIQTHKHLKGLKQAKPARAEYSALSSVVDMAYSAFTDRSCDLLIRAINKYAELMLDMRLVHPATKTILDKLGKSQDVLAAKGCGALGADVVLVLCGSTSKEQTKTFATSLGLAYVSSSDNLSPGLEFNIR